MNKPTQKNSQATFIPWPTTEAEWLEVGKLFANTENSRRAWQWLSAVTVKKLGLP